jgi:hypothetical protein
MHVLGCGNDCVMDEHVGRALDWLLLCHHRRFTCAALGNADEAESDLGTHSLGSGVAMGELMALAEALRYSSPILPRMTGSYVFGV